jgi:hypothetical protein
MKTLKDLKAMMSEPASKEWFAKHGLPKAITHHPLKAKSEALHEAKESPRTKEIRETNERSKHNSLKMVAKSRHEGTNRTSLEERREHIKKMSKDN